MFYAILFLLLVAIGGNAAAKPEQKVAASQKVSLEQWLVAGPYRFERPAFADTSLAALPSLLDIESVDVENIRPEAGAEFSRYPGRSLKWTTLSGPVNLNGDSTQCESLYLAAYLTTSQSCEVRFGVETGPHTPFKAYLDGTQLEGKDLNSDMYRSLRASRYLHRGKHLLLIKSVHGPTSDSWYLTAHADALIPGTVSPLTFSTDPRRPLSNFADAVLFDNIPAPTISPDGKWLAVIHSHRNHDFEKESWIEIYDPKSARLLRTLRPLSSPDNPFFFPNSDRFGFTTAGDSGSTIWVMDLKTGELTPAVKNIIGLVRLVCSPDGKFIYYSADAEKKTDADKPSLWTALEDRMSDWTNTRKLYVASLENGSIHEITATGNFIIDEFALSREGDKLLFDRRIPEIGRPYFSTEFWLYDIPSGKASRVLVAPIPWERRPVSLTWLPGGEKVVYTSARHMIEPGDTAAHPDLIECSLWLLDTHTGSNINLSARENFSVAEDEARSGLLWNSKAKSLYVQVRDKGRVVLMKTDLLASAPKFTEVPLKFPFIEDFSLADNGTCAFIASDPVTPAALYVTDTEGHAPRLIANPSKTTLSQVDLATFERWNFTDSLGYSIDGWIFYPHDFTPNKQWPLVVYYYGGTAPRDERFTFTYHWWAANGYVVYVLNPVGAMGYSEQFASLHANDWGTLATQDIIEGTQKLLAAKPFLDPKKMAAYGGSYGGFITQDLATKTDMFAALVSDAGISDIASYFGGGSWGFTYGDIALPNSFPWNRPDIFAGKSPVYNADKIHTPLLLIHGLADDNVPPIESAEMFTALKVLGRETAWARYPNEDHSIAIKFSDLVDYRELMLAWFDKYLQGQSAAWDDVLSRRAVK